MKDGWVADGARTFAVGEISPVAAKLLEVTEQSLFDAVGQCQVGNRLGDVSHAVQAHVEAEGFSVVRSLVGHGIGRSMHEEPQIPNYGPAGKGVVLEEGMVLAIEPMVTAGRHMVRMGDDGWAIYSQDGSLAAHFEFTVAITAAGPRILTPWHEAGARRGLTRRTAPRRRAADPPRPRSHSADEQAEDGQDAAIGRLAAVALAALVAVRPRARPRGRGPGRRVVPAPAAGTPGRAGSPSRPAPSPRGSRPSGRRSASTAAPSAVTRTTRGRTRAAAAVGLVVRVGPRAVADARARSSAACEPRARKTTGRPRERIRDLRVAARLGAGVLGVDAPGRSGRARSRYWTISQSPSWRPVRSSPRSCGLSANSIQYCSHARRGARRASGRGGRAGTPGHAAGERLDRGERRPARRSRGRRTGAWRASGPARRAARRRRAPASSGERREPPDRHGGA